MEGQSFGEGSLDRPLVRFFFTAACPELGLRKEPVGGFPIGGEVPRFEEKDKKLFCKICGESVSSVAELVTHWRGELERRGGEKAEQKIQGIPYAEVKPLLKIKPQDVKPSNALCSSIDVKLQEKPMENVEHKSEKFVDKEMFDLSIVKMEDLEEKLLECDNCDYACNRSITLQKHKYSKHSLGITLDNIFKCDECEYVCEQIHLFRVHKKEQHKMRIYKCQQCDFACNLKNTLRMHRSSNHKEMQREITCDECDYACGTRDTLRMHKLRKHSSYSKVPTGNGEIEPIIQCDECAYNGLQRHFVLHRKKHKILSCNDCVFKGNFVDLRTHRRKVHDEKRYPCNQCNFRGLTKQRRTRHIKAKHEKSFQYCDKCQYKTTYADNFKLHLKTHDPETWFQCEQCPVRTPTNHMLRNHRDKEHHEITESQYNCLTCNFIAPTKSKLYVHAKNHKEQKEPERQKCKACDFTHFNSHHLKRHFLARHTKTRFQCHYCPCNSHTSTNNNNSNNRQINNNNNKKKTGSNVHTAHTIPIGSLI